MIDRHEFKLANAKYGPATILQAQYVFTGENTIYIDANHHSGTYTDIGVVVRGIRYAASVHATYNPETKVFIAKPGYTFITRADAIRKSDDVSAPARRAVLDALFGALYALRPETLAYHLKCGHLVAARDAHQRAEREAADLADKLVAAQRAARETGQIAEAVAVEMKKLGMPVHKEEVA